MCVGVKNVHVSNLWNDVGEMLWEFMVFLLLDAVLCNSVTFKPIYEKRSFWDICHCIVEIQSHQCHKNLSDCGLCLYSEL